MSETWLTPPLEPEQIAEIREAVEDYDETLDDIVHADRAALLAHVDYLSDAILYAMENLRANGAPQEARLVWGHVEGLTTPQKDWRHRAHIH